MAVVALAEPVDVEDLWQLVSVGLFAELQPVSEVVADVVTTERQHRHRVKAELANRAGGSGGHFRAHRRAEEYAVLPVERLANQRHNGRAATAEEKSVDRHAGRVLPLGRNRRVLICRAGEASVGVRGRRLRARRPVVAVPVDQVIGGLVGHPFPPDVAIVGQRAVSEDGVGVDRSDRVGVRLLTRAWGHAEEAGLRVDCVKAAVVTELHPGDVVADRLDRPAFERWDQHRKVGFAAGRWECAADVLHFAFRRGQLEDQHVLSHPAFVARHH